MGAGGGGQSKRGDETATFGVSGRGWKDGVDGCCEITTRSYGPAI